MHDHRAVVLRNRTGNLAFQVEVLLTADVQLSGQLMRSLRDRGAWITPLENQRVRDVGSAIERRSNVENWLKKLVVDGNESHRAPRYEFVLGNHKSERLREVLDNTACEHRVSGRNVADIDLTRHVIGRQHTQDARHSRR